MRLLNTFLISIALFFSNFSYGQEVSFSFSIETLSYNEKLQNAKPEFDRKSGTSTISLPDEKGDYYDYLVWHSPVVSKEMQLAYPDFKTYVVERVIDRAISGRIFVSRFGIEGIIEREGRMIKIEPLKNEPDDKHKAYLYKPQEQFFCGVNSRDGLINNDEGIRGITTANGGTRRTYEIALVGTGEFYTNANFGNNNATTAQAAIVNIINMVNIRWNKEMAVHFTIFGTPVVYTNAATDPFDPNSTTIDVATQAGNAINTNHPGGGYDLGHGLHATTNGGSGLAYLTVLCNNTVTGSAISKGRAWSSSTTQTGLAIGIMVHEIGHQFGSSHTFNGIGSNCTSQIGSTMAFEIGSGSTIMAYPGLCQANNNIQSEHHLYFHSKSQESFINRMVAVASCATTSASGNTPPTVNANPCSGTYTIPKLTPFKLTGSGIETDANDYILYNWEQINEDGSGTPTQGFIGTTAGNSAIATLFRSYPPSTIGNTRIFPTINTILNSANVSNFEPLPNVARTLNFRLTGRDINASNGGNHCNDISVSVSGTTGPLQVTSPNTAVTWTNGSTQTITWNVNSTSTLFANVDILLSLDGGYSFPIALLSNTPNDGSQSITLGTYSGSSCRIKVRHAPNTCFEVFDISDVNFIISGGCSAVLSSICPIDPVNNTTADVINLGMSTAFGLPLTTRTLTTSGSTSNVPFNTNPLAPGPTTSCSSGNFGFNRRELKFRITGTGSFTFSTVDASVLALYNGSFNSASPCTNIIGCTAYQSGGGATFSNSMTLSLNSTCGLYTLVYFANSGTQTITIIAPYGVEILEDITPSVSNYSYTYAAVNTSTNLVTAVSSTSVFTGIAAGTYCVYGIHYYSGGTNPPATVNPNSLIGQNISTLISSSSCIVASVNCRPLNVTSAYLVTSASDSGAGTFRNIFSAAPENQTITFAPNINPTLISSLTFNKNMNLEGLTSPTTTQLNLNFAGSFGFQLNATKTLTLQNIKINSTGTAAPVFLNNGSLLLNNAEVRGNVLPVITNSNGSTVTVGGTLPSVIKKI
jgi:hypothetical protein